MKTIPFGNNLLIEVVRDDDGVSRTDENENRQRGIVRDYSCMAYHLTASAAIEFRSGFFEDMVAHLKALKKNDAIVIWEQLAEAGQTFEEDGKTYALVPWWRIIGYEKGEGNA